VTATSIHACCAEAEHSGRYCVVVDAPDESDRRERGRDERLGDLTSSA